MPSFKIEEIEPVDYDFRPIVDAHGIIPEPTEGQIRAFVHGLSAYTGEDLTKLDAEEDTTDATGATGWSMMENMADHRPEANRAIAELCSNRPSEEEVAKLPFRVFMQFLRYLQDAMINPEVLGGDSTPPTLETTRPDTGSSAETSDSPSEKSTTSPEPSISSAVAG